MVPSRTKHRQLDQKNICTCTEINKQVCTEKSTIQVKRQK